MADNAAPDMEHLRWAIDHRAKIQHTLLGLYDYARTVSPAVGEAWQIPLLDDLISAAFSLWRAAFLAGELRTYENVRDAQLSFLATVIATNSITFPDDRRNSTWTVSFYLENARHRALSAHKRFNEQYKVSVFDDLLPSLKPRGMYDIGMTQYEWEAAHMLLRSILAMVHPQAKLDVEAPVMPKEPFNDFFNSPTSPTP